MDYQRGYSGLFAHRMGFGLRLRPFGLIPFGIPSFASLQIKPPLGFSSQVCFVNDGRGGMGFGFRLRPFGLIPFGIPSFASLQIKPPLGFSSQVCFVNDGRGGIRTPGPVKDFCFQDRRIRPLCHSSLKRAELAVYLF